MKRIDKKDYNKSMGILIDLEDVITFSEEHIDGAINIPYDKLLTNYKDYLNKTNKYYLYCKKGFKSRKATAILEYYGYDVTQVIS